MYVLLNYRYLFRSVR